MPLSHAVAFAVFVIVFVRTIGVRVHAFGWNTFSIIRVMEPFGFFMAVVAALPRLEPRSPGPALQPVRMLRYST